MNGGDGPLLHLPRARAVQFMPKTLQGVGVIREAVSSDRP